SEVAIPAGEEDELRRFHGPVAPARLARVAGYALVGLCLDVLVQSDPAIPATDAEKQALGGDGHNELRPAGDDHRVIANEAVVDRTAVCDQRPPGIARDGAVEVHAREVNLEVA